MSGLIEKMKNCEGCRKRRKFIKEVFGGIAVAVGLSFLAPRSKADDCEFIFCRDGSEIGLCCDITCDGCVIHHVVRCCLSLIEDCSGEETVYDVCCPQGACPAIDKTGESKLKHQWEVTLDGPGQIIVRSSKSDVDVIAWLERHKLQVKTKSGRTLKAVSANKVVS